MKRISTILIFLICCLPMMAQSGLPAERHQLRKGNKQFSKGELEEAQLRYKKALALDSTSVASYYNLANTLYALENYEEAAACIDKAEEYSCAQNQSMKSDIYFTKGNIAIKQKNWSTATDAFKQVLLETPGDMDAKESYIYAKKMLEDQQQNQDQNNQDQNNQDQNQDQNQNQNQDQDQNQQQNQNQDQNKDQNQDQNKDQDKDQNQDKNNNQDRDQNKQNNGAQPPQSQLSKESIDQMMQANEAKEKDTQDKVKKAQALKAGSRQTDKNW